MEWRTKFMLDCYLCRNTPHFGHDFEGAGSCIGMLTELQLTSNTFLYKSGGLKVGNNTYPSKIADDVTDASSA